MVKTLIEQRQQVFSVSRDLSPKDLAIKLKVSLHLRILEHLLIRMSREHIYICINILLSKGFGFFMTFPIRKTFESIYFYNALHNIRIKPHI